MKILIASDLYWPTINGVSTFSRSLAQGLASRGHEVLVIAPSQTGKKYQEIDGNYKVIRTASTIFPFYQNFKISLSPFREVRKIINDFEPDVIHIQMVIMIGQATMMHARKMGIPVVSTNHAMPENLLDNLKILAPVSKPIQKMLKQYIMRFHLKSDYMTMPTQSAIDMFISEVKKAKMPVEAVSNGIDLTHFTQGEPSKATLKKFKLPTDKPIITYIGRLDAEKHLYVLVNAFMQVLAEKDAHLLIVGDGTDVDNLKMIVNSLKIEDRVTFAGRVSDKDLVDLHKVGMVFCMPSPAELQSIATLEAMASGQPIVAVDAGALGELCQDGRNGYLCDQDDEDAVAKSLLEIISNPELRAKMSRESLAIANTHNLNTTLERFEKIYENLINR